MKFELQAEARDSFGRSGSRRLRRMGRLPAIVYGGGQAPSPITLDHNRIIHEMAREAFYTSILTVKIGKEAESVVVKAVQRHPHKMRLARPYPHACIRASKSQTRLA